MYTVGEVTPEERWLAAMWPTVRASLPDPPAVVVELGCGPLGGFVPQLREGGYEATGIDPDAPDGPHFRRIDFERSDVPGNLDAVIACTSLHHVADPRVVLDKIAARLRPGGLIIVVEWDWEHFDEATAAWSFARLDPADPEAWLEQRRLDWVESGRDWRDYFDEWASEHGLHPAGMLLDELNERFVEQQRVRGPYVFAELAAVTESQEQTAIDAGEIRATRIFYVGAR